MLLILRIRDDFYQVDFPFSKLLDMVDGLTLTTLALFDGIGLAAYSTVPCHLYSNFWKMRNTGQNCHHPILNISDILSYLSQCVDAYIE